MALTECRECGHEISSSAKNCPNCGVKNPSGWFSYTGVGGEGCLKLVGCLAALVFLLFLASMCFGGLAVAG